MKTAEEILSEVTGDNPDYINVELCIKSMKLYANQKLDEAHANLKQTSGQWNSDYYNERNKILSLKDKV